MFVFGLLLELSPEYSLARENLAVTFLNRGVVRAQSGLILQAINDFNLALMLNPSQRTVDAIRRNNVAAFTQLGIFHSNAKQYQLALQWFQRALELDPSDISRKNVAIGMIAVSTAKAETRTRENAGQIFRQPRLMGLSLSECLTAYGATVASLGDITEAGWAFQAALDSDPTNDIARHNLDVVSGPKPDQDIGAGLVSVEIQPFSPAGPSLEAVS
jgi:tetratricopeptide (TPR) repeat protein